MTSLQDALRVGSGHPPRHRDRPVAVAPTVVVVGGAGALGSAILEHLLSHRGIGRVRVAVSRGFTVALNGLEPVQVDAMDWRAAADATARPGALLADTALIVFDRPRHANGRERAFVQPRPAELPALAAWLRARSVARLVVVLPHAPASLPEALKHGLANLDEQAVAALGFERLVFVRSAEAPRDARARRWLQRLANTVLAQLRIMVAASQQPVRAPKVAAFVAELLAQLPASAETIRVAPPELVWHAAQLADPAPLVAAWLGQRELPAPPRPKRIVR